MPKRIFNFAAGPCTLPLPTLEKAQSEFVNFQDAGMSLFEMSHRGPIYDAVHKEALKLFREVYEIPETHRILFIGGGATLQFAMIPMNFLTEGRFAEYVNTGTWSTKAIKDARLIGDAREIASGKDDNFMKIPKGFTVSPDAAYLHITTNNTIKGTEYHVIPDSGSVPLVADMSSDFLSRPVDWARYGLVYGGAQKNLGPSGLCVVIISDAFLSRSNEALPAYLRYDLHAGADSMYNTPPMFQIYMLKLVLEWVIQQGGLVAMDRAADERSQLLYSLFDQYPEYYRCPVAREDRSRMNVCFRLPSEDLEKKFLAEAGGRGLSGLKGHRSVGGCRASLYNAMPIQGVEALVAFMKEFMNGNPV